MFTRELFAFAGKPVSLLILMEFTLIMTAVFVLARLTRKTLRDRLLARTTLSLGLQKIIVWIAGYSVIVIGTMVGLHTLGF